MKYTLLFGPQLCDSTAETVYTNLTGTATIIDSLTLANPAGGASANVVLSIGADAAGTRVIVYPLPAGPYTAFLYPGITVTGTSTIQLSCTTDDIVVATCSGRVEAV